MEYFLAPGPCEHGGVYPNVLPWKFWPKVPTFVAPADIDVAVFGILKTVR